MKLYVGSLDFQTTQKELEDLFATVGTVESANIITDKYSGRSKGFGFVEMPDDQAKEAISTLNGKTLGGREIVVNEARPKKERKPGGGDFNKERW